MSGGFFRGTSADQDTRFSNKQAKLLKSQKFASELEQLVDMTKVKMDVIRPWIANRVTELLGFEDEVLINFIYGLLDGKEVDGKQIQIQLTGFMEKNTGRFMKELWGLLLSAQKNVSGVPQQFLDAKEEETRKKKEEADRITNEIQKKREKEGREVELERQRKMDREGDILKAKNAASDANSKHPLPKSSSIRPDEERETDDRHASRGKNGFSRSPRSLNHSPTTHRSPSPDKSSSKSFSNSRSYSEERHNSRSISPQPWKRSLSRERRYRSPRRRSVSPRRRYSPRTLRSPLRRSPRPRRRSISHSRRRSRSPIHRRSRTPIRRRSPSPIRRRSPSPIRRRSPSPMRRRSPSAIRRRSLSPLRRRSPPSARWRSPSPLQHRSPSLMWQRSPIPRRRSPSPSRHRSPSPKWRSPSPPRRLSPSPLRRRSPLPRSPRNRRRSPVRSPRRRAVGSPRQRNRTRSPPYRSRRSLSRERNSHVDGVESRRNRDDFASQRMRGKASPIRLSLGEDEVPHTGSGQKRSDYMSPQLPISLRSPQRDPRDHSDGRRKKPQFSPPPETSPAPSESPPQIQKLDQTEDRSQSESPARQTIKWATRHDSPESSREEEKIILKREDKIGHRADSSRKRNRNSPGLGSRKKSISMSSDPEKETQGYAVSRSTEDRAGPDHAELRKKDRHDKSDNASLKTDFRERHRQRPRSSVEKEYGPGWRERDGFSPDNVHDEQPSVRQCARYYSSPEKRLSSEPPIEKRSHLKDYIVGKTQQLHSSDDEYSDPGHKTEAVNRSARKVDQIDHAGTYDSDSDRYDSRSEHLEKRRYKKPESHLDDDSGYDLQKDEKKEAKRRRKEEKRLRKEEKRRRREERHRRREERRAGKLKTRPVDTVTPPSDFEKNRNDAVDSDDDAAMRRDKYPSDSDETESEQKKLEIELRKKALESLRAKKAISH